MTAPSLHEREHSAFDITSHNFWSGPFAVRDERFARLRAGGPHFCLGNQLAKTELRNLFRELLTRLKAVELGEPDLLHSSFVHGVKRLPAHVR